MQIELGQEIYSNFHIILHILKYNYLNHPRMNKENNNDGYAVEKNHIDRNGE